MGELLEMLTSDLHLDATQMAGVRMQCKAFREKKTIKAAGGDRSQMQQAKQRDERPVYRPFERPAKTSFTANLAKYDGILFGEQWQPALNTKHTALH